MTDATAETPSSKHCGRCKTDKAADQFYRDKHTASGLTSYCRDCKRELLRIYQATPAGRASVKRRAQVQAAKHPDRVAERQRRWREANPGYSARANEIWRAANPGRSSEWYQANREKVRENYLRRRALIREVTVGDVDIEALWLTNNGTCQLCAEPIDRSLRGPHPMAASIDHIVPLSKGGTHEQANLQWAHLVCNKRKGATAPRDLDQAV